MERELRAMLDLLLEQKGILEKLLELSCEKKQVIIKNDTERLNRIVQSEVALLSGMTAAEKKRMSLVNALAGELDLPAKELTVSVLAGRAQGVTRERLFALRDDISSLLRRQSEANELNRKLMETQLEYSDMMLGAIVGEEDPLNHFYGDDGRTEPERRKSAGLVDRQV